VNFGIFGKSLATQRIVRLTQLDSLESPEVDDLQQRVLFGEANQIAEFNAKGPGQLVCNFDTHAYLAQLDGANVGAMHVGSLRKLFL
jgi:hypothetical protein